MFFNIRGLCGIREEFLVLKSRKYAKKIVLIQIKFFMKG